MLMSELQYLYGLYLTLPVITQGFIAVIGVLTILIVGPFYNNRTVIFGPTVLTMGQVLELLDNLI
jgi:hypothetical protein